MKVFVTGVGGQLGHDVMNELAKRGFEGIGSDIQPEYSGADDGTSVTKMPYVRLDITDEKEVETVIGQIRPDAVVHCAAWTAVDAAEEPENIQKVHAINIQGTQFIAAACRHVDAAMLYLSTDYVFDGQGSEPWEPDCRDYKPLNEYGRSKLAGEIAVSSALTKYFIVRIAWVFGSNGNNFVKTMLNVGRTHDTVRVVCDQIGTPTYTYDLARLLVDMLQTDRYGYYHATNSELPPAPSADAAAGKDPEHDGDGTKRGYISWYDFTKEIYRQAGLDTKIIPVTTKEYGLSKAARPVNSRLDKSKLSENGFAQLPYWKNALRRYLKILGVDAAE